MNGKELIELGYKPGPHFQEMILLAQELAGNG